MNLRIFEKPLEAFAFHAFLDFKHVGQVTEWNRRLGQETLEVFLVLWVHPRLRRAQLPGGQGVESDPAYH